MTVIRSRAATVPLVAGLPCLDLVNTISWRGAPSRSEDHLQTVPDCLTWAVRTGTLDQAEARELGLCLDGRPAAAEELTAGLRALRAVVAEVATEPSADADENARRAIVEAMEHADLAPVQGSRDRLSHRWQISKLDEHVIRRRLALDLHRLLTSTTGHVGVCADQDCRWVFLDTSHAQSRRWCDSRDCGNRHRVRLHQQRNR